MSENWYLVSWVSFETPSISVGWIKEDGTEPLTSDNRTNVVFPVMLSEDAVLIDSSDTAPQGYVRIEATEGNVVSISASGGFTGKVDKKYIIYPSI